MNRPWYGFTFWTWKMPFFREKVLKREAGIGAGAGHLILKTHVR